MRRMHIYMLTIIHYGCLHRGNLRLVTCTRTHIIYTLTHTRIQYKVLSVPHQRWGRIFVFTTIAPTQLTQSKACAASKGQASRRRIFPHHHCILEARASLAAKRKEPPNGEVGYKNACSLAKGADCCSTPLLP